MLSLSQLWPGSQVYEMAQELLVVTILVCVFLLLLLLTLLSHCTCYFSTGNTKRRIRAFFWRECRGLAALREENPRKIYDNSRHVTKLHPELSTNFMSVRFRAS